MKLSSLILLSCTSVQSTLAFAPLSSLSFSSQKSSSSLEKNQSKYPYPKLIASIFDDDKSEPENEFDGFNPFNRKETKTQQRAPQIFGSNTISLRQMRMKELMSSLLNAGGEAELMSKILLENEELLMEPLLDDDAMYDVDSIYERGMSLDERFDRYESELLGREAKAVNGNVTNLLATMREFVMSRRPSPS